MQNQTGKENAKGLGYIYMYIFKKCLLSSGYLKQEKTPTAKH